MAVPPAGSAPPRPVALRDVPTNSARGSVLALINSTVGAGVLAFPFAFRQTGWAAGLATTLLVGAVEACTMFVLARFAEATGSQTYSILVGRTLGRAASLAMCLVLFLYPFGSCVAYLVITGDSFQPLLLRAFGEAWWTSRPAVISGIGCSVILPLCFPRHLGALKAVSSACLYGLAVVVGAIVFRSSQVVLAPDYDWGPVRAFKPSISFLNALPLIVFAFQCHTNVVSIWDELEPRPALFRRSAAAGRALAPEHSPPGGPQQRGMSGKLAGMIRVVAAGVGITGVFYSSVAVAGYLAFPLTARSNITLNFRQDDWLIGVARAAIGVIQCCAYPVNHHPARGAVRDFARQTTGARLGGRAFHVLEPLLFFGATLGLALLCSDLGAILKLVGGTCGSMLIFLFPGAMLMQHCLREEAGPSTAALREALLPPPASDEPAVPSVGSLPGSPGGVQAYRRWLFWCGALLVLVGLLVAALAVVTTLRPLPS